MCEAAQKPSPCENIFTEYQSDDYFLTKLVEFYWIYILLFTFLHIKLRQELWILGL